MIIRRDNIGDLVCTTPLISRVRQRYPYAHLSVFCNSYNAPILKNNPNVDWVYFYTKSKHVDNILSRFKAMLRTLATVINLRRQKIDLALVASPGGTKYAKLIGARKIVCKPEGNTTPMHEVASCLAIIGVQADETKDKLLIVPDPVAVEKLFKSFPVPAPATQRIAVQISARRVLQQWSVENYRALIERLTEKGFQVLLFWSPGQANHPQHPGDDEKATAIIQQLSAFASSNTYPIATQHLEELIAGFSSCDAVISPDGGAMHIAAGLGKPIVALFGDTTPVHWSPWGVRNILLKAEQTGCIAEITPPQVADALLKLTRAQS